MKKLIGDADHIKENLYAYIQAFAPAVRDIFERFDFYVQIERLAKAGLLYQVTDRFAQVDLHPGKVNNMQMASISSTNIMELPVVIPPTDEQEALLDMIDSQSATFDQLIDDARIGIRLLRERRTALISAAVTGLIDVRSTAVASTKPSHAERAATRDAR